MYTCKHSSQRHTRLSRSILYRNSQTTRKSDVYAFGVVLFEVLCGRPAVDTRLEEEQINLAGWAEQCYKEGRLDQITDSNIKGDISSDSLNEYVDVAIKCLHNQPKLRPTMAEVVVSLESALTLQEKSTHYTLVEIMPTDYSHENVDSSIPEVEYPKQNREELVNVSNVWYHTKKSSGRMKFTKTVSSFLLLGARVFSGNKAAKTSIYSDHKLATKRYAVPAYPSVPPTLGRQEKDLQSLKLKRFEYIDIKSATRNFRPDSLLGEGDFGRVFKGWIDKNTFAPTIWGSGLVVAIKRLDINGSQGHQEWLAELSYLGTLGHPNLLKLIGYCIEEEQRFLVYDYMPRGSLENHIFKSHLTMKSDVYGFGVVLLELLTGRRVIDQELPTKKQNLVSWAKPYLTNKDKILHVMDARIEGQYTVGAALAASSLVLKCISIDPKVRPQADQVVKELENLQDL